MRPADAATAGQCMKIVVCALWLAVGATAHTAERLPKAMLGNWASDPSACANASSELRMTVEPRTVLFYETAHRIRRVVRLPGGALRASGTSVGETRDDRASASLVLKQVAPDRLEVGKGQIYYRCKTESPQGYVPAAPPDRRSISNFDVLEEPAAIIAD